MPIFLVERDLPGVTRDQFRAAQRATEAAAARATAAGTPVRSLRSVFVPSEGRAVCLFEGPDADTVRAVNTSAGVPFSHLVEVVEFTAT